MLSKDSRLSVSRVEDSTENCETENKKNKTLKRNHEETILDINKKSCKKEKKKHKKHGVESQNNSIVEASASRNTSSVKKHKKKKLDIE